MHELGISVATVLTRIAGCSGNHPEARLNAGSFFEVASPGWECSGIRWILAGKTRFLDSRAGELPGRVEDGQCSSAAV